MKRLLFQVAVGPQRPLFERCMASVATYAKRHGFDHIVQREPVLRIVPKKSARSEGALRLGYLPIFEKFQSFTYLERYDEILVLDGDVYVRPGAPSIFEILPPALDFAAVAEPLMPLSLAYKSKAHRYAAAQFGDVRFCYFNMGVRVIRRSILPFLKDQTPTEFIHRPEFAPFVNGDGPHRWATEQILLNRWVVDSGMANGVIPWVWNTLYGAVEPKHVAAGHFIHFFLSDHLPHDDIPRLLAEPEKVVRR